MTPSPERGAPRPARFQTASLTPAAVRWRAALAGAALLALVGCGGGEDPIASGPTATALSAATGTPPSLPAECPGATRSLAGAVVETTPLAVPAPQTTCR